MKKTMLAISLLVAPAMASASISAKSNDAYIPSIIEIDVTYCGTPENPVAVRIHDDLQYVPLKGNWLVQLKPAEHYNDLDPRGYFYKQTIVGELTGVTEFSEVDPKNKSVDCLRFLTSHYSLNHPDNKGFDFSIGENYKDLTEYLDQSFPLL